MPNFLEKYCHSNTLNKQFFLTLQFKFNLLVITSILLISTQSCDILDSDKNQTIDPPIFPCPYQDVSISTDGQEFIYFRTKLTILNHDGTGEYDRDSTGIWKCNSDGTNPLLLFKSDWNSSSPHFIPHSSYILFNYGNQIVKAPYNDRLNQETDLIFLTTVGENFFPTISGNGGIVSYDSNYDSPRGMFFIWVMNIDGTNKKRIAYDPESGEIRMPSLYPSIDKILHIRYVNNNDGSPEIFSMDKEGNNVMRITFNSKFDKSPRLNFYSNRILFISDKKLFSIDTSGTDLFQLTSYDVQSATWTPENKVAYVKYNTNEFSIKNGTLWIMDDDGQNNHQITYNYDLELKGGN